MSSIPTVVDNLPIPRRIVEGFWKAAESKSIRRPLFGMSPDELMTPEYLRWNYSRMGDEVRLKIGRDQERRIIATMNRLGVKMWHSNKRQDVHLVIDCIFEPVRELKHMANLRSDQWGSLKIRVAGRDVPCVLRYGPALMNTARDIRSIADWLMLVKRTGWNYWYPMKQVKVLGLAADDYYITVKGKEWSVQHEPDLGRWELHRHDDPHSGHPKLNCYIKPEALDLVAQYYVFSEWEDGVDNRGME